MSNRPSFQFYPADWRNDSNLRRCSEAARGCWMDVLCVLHDSSEYGIVRWPLVDLARSAGVPVKHLKELAEKGVLKGSDKGCDDFIYAPRHGGQTGKPVTLISSTKDPIWYCARFVRDEHVRQVRGKDTRFTSTKDTPEQSPKTSPKTSPKGGLGERQGYGPSSSSSSSNIKKELSLSAHDEIAPIQEPEPPPNRPLQIPEFSMTEDWIPSDSLAAQIRLSGMQPPDDQAFRACLASFRLYWTGRPTVRNTQNSWDGKFLSALHKNGVKNGPSNRNPGQTQKLSVADRIAARGGLYRDDSGQFVERAEYSPSTQVLDQDGRALRVAVDNREWI